jgi:Protein of unknown function (DUF2934)
MARTKPPKKVNGENTSVPATSNSLASQNGASGETTSGAFASPRTDTEVKSAPARKIARKPEIVKSEPRANLLPINLEDEIRQLAYLLSERRGFEPGHETEDWLNAEREVRQRYHQYSA